MKPERSRPASTGFSSVGPQSRTCAPSIPPIAFEIRKLTSMDKALPAYVPEVLAVVKNLRVLHNYLLSRGTPRAPGFFSDFMLRRDSRMTWLCTK